MQQQTELNTCQGHCVFQSLLIFKYIVFWSNIGGMLEQGMSVPIVDTIS